MSTDRRGSVTLPPVDAFLDAKLHPPTVRRKWVTRDRLIRALDHASECPLTLVAAPAGYGKTTLVAQWVSQLENRRVAWVALDAADNDPVRLWTHIATALARVGNPIDNEIPGFVAAHRTGIVTVVIPKIVGALDALNHRVMIILDDFHFVHAADCLEQVNFLIEHLPSSADIMIIARADPALRIGRLRVSGRLAEIRADRLSFDTAEATSLLGSEGVRLSDQSLSELIARTEGWPAGLYLATLSLVDRNDPDGFVHRLEADDRFIVGYLTEEVISRQSADVRSFILGVSIFEQFSPALCDYVLERSSSGAILRDLERSNLFVESLDANRRWFRFHHLFAAVVRSELAAEDADRFRLLHDRAADWFAARGFVAEAFRHAIASGSISRALELLQTNWVRYVDAGREATVHGWLQALDALSGSEAETELATLVRRWDGGGLWR